MSAKKLRELQRIEELEVTHTGEVSCVPPHQLVWNDCVQKKAKIEGTDIEGGVEVGVDISECSYKCLTNPDCKYWLWDGTLEKCSLKSEMTDNSTSYEATSYWGETGCSGRVGEARETDETPLDGEWSPWSTIGTRGPCPPYTM